MIRLALATCLMLSTVAGSARAQRFRVVVGNEHGPRTAVEFRPCIPAEGSGCGAWIDREALPDTVSPLIRLTSVRFGRRDSVWLERGAIRIRTGNKELKTLVDQRGAAEAVAIAPSMDYAFVLLHSAATSATTIVMVDLSTRSVIANCPVPGEPSAIAVVR